MKKLVSLSVVALLIIAMSATAFASGHYRRSMALNTNYQYTTNGYGCSQSGVHSHNGVTYNGYCNNYSNQNGTQSGKQNGYCGYNNCTINGNHTHQGQGCGGNGGGCRR